MKLQKPLLMVIVLALTISTGLTVTQASNDLISNGGFEQGNLNGWSVIGYPSAIHYRSHSGKYSVQLGSKHGTGQISQDFTIPLWASARLSFWYFGGPGDYGTGALVVSLTASNGAVINRWDGKIDFRWHQVNYDIPSQYSGQTLTIRFYGQPDFVYDYSYLCFSSLTCKRPHIVKTYLIPAFVFVDDVSVTYS
jgi:hypothetical protein